MITKIVLTALALTIGTASTALAANGKWAHSTKPAHDVYSTSGKYLGSDPDARIRAELDRARADN
jgi:hypothetical protein